MLLWDWGGGGGGAWNMLRCNFLAEAWPTPTSSLCGFVELQEGDDIHANSSSVTCAKMAFFLITKQDWLLFSYYIVLPIQGQRRFCVSRWLSSWLRMGNQLSPGQFGSNASTNLNYDTRWYSSLLFVNIAVFFLLTCFQKSALVAILELRGSGSRWGWTLTIQAWLAIFIDVFITAKTKRRTTALSRELMGAGASRITFLAVLHRAMQALRDCMSCILYQKVRRTDGPREEGRGGRGGRGRGRGATMDNELVTNYLWWLESSMLWTQAINRLLPPRP